MQIVQIDVNCCKCEFPAEELVLKIERCAQRLTHGYNALGGSYSCAPGENLFPLRLNHLVFPYTILKRTARLFEFDFRVLPFNVSFRHS